MKSTLDYRYGQANAADIIKHFLGCDTAFLDALRLRTHLPDYASKLHARALRYEAWAGHRLVGLLAVYRDDTAKTAYISNVSVLSEYCRQGIASQMLSLCLAQARNLNVLEVVLEVVRDNHAAIELYRRHGFLRPPGPQEHILRMRLDLMQC